MVRERYTSDGIPEWQVMKSRDERVAYLRAKNAPVETVPYHSVGFFKKVWKMVVGF